jgi:hypothetical protein
LSNVTAATLAAARGLLNERERELTNWLPSTAPQRLKIEDFGEGRKIAAP